MNAAPDTHAPPTGPLAARVFAKLGAGGFHSGEQLATDLAVSRNAIWKAVGALKERGVAIHAVRNRGYRLAVPTAALDARVIRAGLDAPTRARVRQLEVAWELASTNTTLFARSDLPAGQCDALLAEVQSAGRGRRGRTWLATPGGTLCLSVGWTLPQLPRDMGALSLVVGVCALQALTRHVPAAVLLATPLQLKWPNDLVCGGAKLGGILIDMRAEAGGPSYVVIGIGINVFLDEAARERVRAAGAQGCDLRSLEVPPLQRNAVAASLIQCLVTGLLAFEAGGFGAFREQWARADALKDKPVNVVTDREPIRGIAQGIDAEGALLVNCAGTVVRFVSGDVSVRSE